MTRSAWRPLLLLTAAVLAAHWWLLRAAPGVFQPSAAPGRGVPITHRIVLAPAAEVAPAPVLAPPAGTTAAPALDTPGPKVTTPAMPARGAAQPTPEAPLAATAPPASGAKPSLTPAVAIPGSMLLRYEVSASVRGIALQAASRLHWRHDGSEYEARLELSGPLFPARSQRSNGRITPEGLAPLRFSDKARREEAVHFQRDEGKVSFSSNRPDAPLMAGAQDRLSVMLQLGALIAGDPAKFGPATVISIQTAGTRDAEPWQFTVEGEDELRLPGGDVRALKLTRNPRKEFDQKVELWLAPAMDYVPVRLRLTQPNGDWVDQQWSSTDKG